jgi:predicted Zn-dependent peptidase
VTTVDRSRLPDVGDDPAFVFPRIVHHRLPNGVRVRTVEHHSAPVVTFIVIVEGGSGVDPVGQDGLMSLTADMVDEGTGSLSAIDVSDAIARVGGDYDVEVSPDVTMFTFTTLARFARRAAALLADMLLRPNLLPKDFERVRQLRVDRLKQLKDLAPALAERSFLRLMYGSHPYGHLSIGDETALAALTGDDVVRCHQARYRPNRTTIVVSGGLSHEDLAAAASDAFGSWTARDNGPAQEQAPETMEARSAPSRLVVVPREGAAQSELRIGHLAARRDTPDYASLLVLNSVMGGQFVSRINLKLREEKGYTYGARTGFDWRRGLAPFVLQASVHTASTADAIADSLQEIEAVRGTRPPSESELTLAKASLTRGYPRNFETAQQVARAVAQLAVFGLPDSYFEEFVPRVGRVTGKDVLDVAARYLDPARMVTLVVGDLAAISTSLETLGLGQVELLAPS